MACLHRQNALPMPRPLPSISPSPLQRLHLPWAEKAGIALWLKRDDLLHPHISGNKWRKLAPNLAVAARAGHRHLLTFGGAYSNHLTAVAAAGHLLGFRTTGIVRGERIEPLNPSLSFAERHGMRLYFLSRSDFRLRKKPEAWPEWQRLVGPCYILPEGGSNDLAVEGCVAIAREVEAAGIAPDYWFVAAGTGATAAGIIRGKRCGQVLAVSSLKGNFLEREIEHFAGCPPGPHWQLAAAYHHGGFAKWTPALIAFINGFRQTTGVRLDPIYTGKMMWAVYRLALSGFFRRGSQVVAIHTGGLQGIAGFNERFGARVW